MDFSARLRKKVTILDSMTLFLEATGFPAARFNANDLTRCPTQQIGHLSSKLYQDICQIVPKKVIKVMLIEHSPRMYSIVVPGTPDFWIVGPFGINLSDQSFAGHYLIALSQNRATINISYDRLKYLVTLLGNLTDTSDNFDLKQIFDSRLKCPINDFEILAVKSFEHGTHVSYDFERAISLAIETGSVHEVPKYLTSLIRSGRIGKLSDEGDLRSIKNWGIIGISVFIRSAIRGGVDPDQGYSLNDQYVRKLDQLTSTEAVIHYVFNCVIELAETVNHLYVSNLSHPVRQIYEMILNDPISLKPISDYAASVQLSPRYLASLFNREVGVSIIYFRTLVRIQHAIQMLTTTDQSITEIATNLNFSDQPYFTRVFSKIVAHSPGEVRRHPNLVNNWHLQNFLKD